MNIKCNLDKFKNIFENQGDYQKAVFLYSEEIKKNPKIEELYYRICFCAFELYDKDSFIFWYTEYQKHIIPTKVIHNFLSIYLYFFEGDLVEIENILSKIEYNTYYPEEFYGFLLGFYLYIGDSKKGLEIGNQMRKIYYDNWMIFYYTANHYCSIGQYEVGYNLISSISENKYSYILDMKLKLLQRLGKKYEKNIKKTIKILYNFIPNIYEYSSIGNSYFTIGEYSKAIQYYKKSIDIFPYDSYSYNGIGNCYLVLGKPIQARKIYLRGLSNLIGVSKKYSILGIAKTYVYEKRYSDAYKILEKYIDEYGNTTDYLYQISKCMIFSQIYNKQVLFYLEKALLINPHHGASKRLLKKIKKRILIDGN